MKPAQKHKSPFTTIPVGRGHSRPITPIQQSSVHQILEVNKFPPPKNKLLPKRDTLVIPNWAEGPVRNLLSATPPPRRLRKLLAGLLHDCLVTIASCWASTSRPRITMPRSFSNSSAPANQSPPTTSGSPPSAASTLSHC